MIEPMSTPAMSFLGIQSDNGNGKVQNPASEFGSQYSNFIQSSNHSVGSESESVYSHFPPLTTRTDLTSNFIQSSNHSVASESESVYSHLRASAPLTTRSDLTSESGWSNAGEPTFRSSISV